MYGAQALCTTIAQTLTDQNHDGLIVDFETHQTVTSKDTAAFAQFVHSLATSLHARGKILSVTVSPGKPFLDDLKSIVAAGPDQLQDFGTYADNFTVFTSKLNAALKYVPGSKLNLGLKSRHSNLTKAELQERFDAAHKAGVDWLLIWARVNL